VELARRHGTRLHVLHLTTARELELFEDKPLTQKHISAEVCLHHLLFDDRDYPALGNLIKCNPAIKTQADRDALRAALLSNRLDVIGSDHAPHTWAEKQRPYTEAPSGYRWCNTPCRHCSSWWPMACCRSPRWWRRPAIAWRICLRFRIGVICARVLGGSAG
jgi:dihydroorotase-like cyclic amidohydrolase